MTSEYHRNLDASIAAARAEIKKRAKHFPNDFPEYGQWKLAQEMLKRAQQREREAKAAWDKIRK